MIYENRYFYIKKNDERNILLLWRGIKISSAAYEIDASIDISLHLEIVSLILNICADLIEFKQLI
jgi:hypothetical protein